MSEIRLEYDKNVFDGLYSPDRILLIHFGGHLHSDEPFEDALELGRRRREQELWAKVVKAHEE